MASRSADDNEPWPQHVPTSERSSTEERELLLEKAALLASMDKSKWSWQQNYVLQQELHHHLSKASAAILEDREVALAVASAEGPLLQYFEERLRGDAEVAMAAVESQGSAFEHVGEALRGDKAILLRAVKTSSRALLWATRPLRDDREAVLEAVRCAGHALEHASAELRADQEVVLAAVEQSGYALRFASDQLRSCKDVVLAAVKSIGEELRESCECDQELLVRILVQDGSGLRFASEGLRGDNNFALEAVKHDWTTLFDLNDELRDDREIVLAALSQNGGALAFASYTLRADRDIVLKAISQSADSMKFASDDLRSDKDFVLLAARSCNSEDVETCYEEAHDSLQDTISWDTFEGAFQSSLAVRGQLAPVLTATLSQRDDEPNTIWCDINLLSGSCFAIQLSSTTDTSRLGPSVNDLAKLLVAELPRHSEAMHTRSIFLTFVNNDAEFYSATAWDWNRPLREFLR